MKKFIAAFDGLAFSESTSQYALELTRNSDAHLVGVFLEDFTRHSYSMVDITNYGGSDYEKYIERMDERDAYQRSESVEKFEEACKAAGIHYSIHRDGSIAMQELLHESIYADLLIVGDSQSFTKYQEHPPTRFIRELLSNVQCPVLLVPPKHKAVEKICFLYDGSPASVNALRRFSYLFPASSGLPQEILTVKSPEDDLHLPDNHLMKEFVKRHYPDARYTVLQGYPREQISSYIRNQEPDAIIVMGAYQRSQLSRAFKPSLADHLVKKLNQPIFVC